MLYFIQCADDTNDPNDTNDTNDTNVFHKHENIEMMCKIVSVGLDKLSTSFALNKLALDISKTNHKILTIRKSIENNISMNGVNLQKVDGLIFLGVFIYHQITWKDQITYISNKLSKRIAIIHRASHVLDTIALYCLSSAIFQPHLNYCIEVWELLIKAMSTHYVFYNERLCELYLMQGH